MPALRRQSHSPHHRAAALAFGAAVLAACSAPPELLPPPFGPDVNAPRPARLFYPTGIAAAPSGQLLVVNGNFNHEFDSGTIVALDPAWIAGIFANPANVFDASNGLVNLDIPNDPKSSDPAKRSVFQGVAMIGSYGGPLTLDNRPASPGGASVVRAYTGSRDTSRLNGTILDPSSGKLSCMYGKGSTDIDCRGGILDMKAAYSLEGPYSIVPGAARLPGATADQDVLFVSALIPTITEVTNGVLYTRATVAALLPFDAGDTAATAPSAYYVAAASSATLAGGIGSGPMVFDGQRRQLILGGCFTRYAAGSIGEASSGKCGLSRSTNLLRFMGVDEGPDAHVQVVDIATDIRSVDTTDLALGNLDPVTHFARTLYVAARNPDLLAEIDLPSDPRQLVAVRRVTPMPISPAQVLLLKRPATIPGPDLVLISSEVSGSVAIYDATASQVVAQVERLGTAPFALVQLGDSTDGTKAQIALSIFGDCRVALIDVDYARPWQARLRGRLGSCPP